MHSSWLNWAFTKESYAVAHPLFRERYPSVEVRPGQTPAHSRPLIPYTTTRDTISRKDCSRLWCAIIGVGTTQKPRITQKPERQLRPFIAGAYRGPKGVSLFAPAFCGDENQLWALYDGLVRHLLHCHSVGIENPLTCTPRG